MAAKKAKKAKNKAPKVSKGAKKEVPQEGIDPETGEVTYARFTGPVYSTKDKKKQFARVEKSKSDYRPRKESLAVGDSKVAFGRVDKETGRRKRFRVVREA